jgi:hypothetical protein
MHLFPYQTDNVISLTFTIYGSLRENLHGFTAVTKREFTLRQLNGKTEDEQIQHAHQIMNEVAREIRYLTSFGVDSGIIKVGNKKVLETTYPNLPPHRDDYRYFIYSVLLQFTAANYLWVKGDKKKWNIKQTEVNDGWQIKPVQLPERVSFRLPCMPSTLREKQELDKDNQNFFTYLSSHKQGRKVIGWNVGYNRDDEIFTRFIRRFQQDGHLCFGKRNYFTLREGVYIQGRKWPFSKAKPKKVPRKSRLVSQPTDNTDYVYLIRAGRRKLYKIGKTNDPQDRLTSLQTASPDKLKLVHTFKADNASAAEESLHAALQNKRIQGEWFQLSDKQQNSISNVIEYKNNKFVTKDGDLSASELLQD